MAEQRCPACDGTGLFILEQPTCPACGGRGRVGTVNGIDLPRLADAIHVVEPCADYSLREDHPLFCPCMGRAQKFAAEYALGGSRHGVES